MWSHLFFKFTPLARNTFAGQDPLRNEELCATPSVQKFQPVPGPRCPSRNGCYRLRLEALLLFVPAGCWENSMRGSRGGAPCPLVIFHDVGGPCQLTDTRRNNQSGCFGTQPPRDVSQRSRPQSASSDRELAGKRAHRGVGVSRERNVPARKLLSQLPEAPRHRKGGQGAVPTEARVAFAPTACPSCKRGAVCPWSDSSMPLISLIRRARAGGQ